MRELVTALSGDAAIAAQAGDRIYPQVMPDNPVLPALTYTIISGVPQNSLEGHTSGLERYTVQIDCWSRNYAEAVDLADAVHDLLGTTRVVAGLKGYRTNRTDGYEDSTRLHSVSLDFIIWKEAAP